MRNPLTSTFHQRAMVKWKHCRDVDKGIGNNCWMEEPAGEQSRKEEKL